MGIPVAEPYARVFKSMREYLEPEIVFRTNAFDNRGDFCVINKEGVFVYDVFYYADSSICVLLNPRIKDLYKTTYIWLNINELETLSKEILKRAGVVFKTLHISASTENLEYTKFWELQKIYESGKYKLVDFETLKLFK